MQNCSQAYSQEIWIWLSDLVKALPDWLATLSEIITWPILILLILFCFQSSLHKLLDECANFIKRLKKGPFGIELHEQYEQKSNSGSTNPEAPQIAIPNVSNKIIQKDDSQTEHASKAEEMSAVRLVEYLENLYTSNQVNPIKENFKAAISAYAGTISEQNDLLLTLTSILNISLAHERNYRLIFGSQIELLKRISRSIVLKIDAAKELYELVAQHPPFAEFYKTYDFISWLHFLKTIGLCEFINDGIVLTAYGSGFLQYLSTNQLSDHKPY